MLPELNKTFLLTYTHYTHTAHYPPPPAVDSHMLFALCRCVDLGVGVLTP